MKLSQAHIHVTPMHTSNFARDETMDVLSKMFVLAVVVATAIIVAEGHEPPFVDTCTAPPDSIDSNTDSGGSSSCEILKDFPPFLAVYENRSAELCIFATNQCNEGHVLWNNIPYYHGRPASRTPVTGGVVVFRFVLEPGETTIAENGSRVQFIVSTGIRDSVLSEVAEILIVGPPVPPQNISVTLNNCSTADVTWSKSPGARSYNVTVECGDAPVVHNAIVYNNTFEFSYHVDQRQCTISVFAVNPAGSSAMNYVTKSLFKESNYSLNDLGVKFEDGKALIFFNITVLNECSYSGPHYAVLCVDTDENCVNVTVGFISTNRLYKVLQELLLSPHKHFRVNITVCDAQKCTTFSKPVSTFHINSVGGCGSDGECIMKCEAVPGYPVNGCVYTITDQRTNMTIETQYIEIGGTMRYNIKYDGLFTISVYDWEEGIDWNRLPPVATSIVQVSKNKINDNNIGWIAGSSVASTFILLIAIVLIILLFVWLHNRHTGRQVFNDDTGRQRCGDTVIPMDNLDNKGLDDGTKSENIEKTPPPSVTSDAPSSVADTDEEGEGVMLDTAIMPKGMSETVIQKGVSETVSTSVYGSEDPLLNTSTERSPPRPPVKHTDGSGGGRPCVEMISQKSLTSKYANTVQQKTGLSVQTGEEMVTVQDIESTAGFLCGSKVYPAAEETKGFSLDRPSQEQSGMNDGQAADVVPGVLH